MKPGEPWLEVGVDHTRLTKILLALATLGVAANAQAELAGALEFNVGFGGTATGDPDKGPSADTDLTTTLGITPMVEQMLGKVVGLGGEFGFLWAAPDAKDADGDAITRRLLLNPSARVRMSFPIVDQATFDGFLAIGPSFWLSQDKVPDAAGGAFRLGWGLRFGFGGSYAVNKSVAVYANVGYQRLQSFGDDLTLTYSSVPLNLGLRSQF